MSMRIVVIHKCDHPGKHLQPVVDKYWDTTPERMTRVCYCLRDGENGKQKATPMIATIITTENAPE